MVGGHTHVQFDRVVDGIRLRQRGQRRHAVRGPAGRVLGAARRRDVELRHTQYDVEAAAVADSGDAAIRRPTRSPRRWSSRRIPTRSRPTSRALPRSFVREARRPVGPRRDRIRPIIERLAAEHADARIALRFRNDLELLVSVMLSAQTTDVNVNRVTERLFEKYRRPEDYLAVPQEELERDIYATGFFRQKTKSMRGTMRVLLEEFDGQVPRTIQELLRLPGVARKTANVVAAELGNAQGIVVDTHVRRLSQRLGLDEARGPGQDRARPRGSSRARTGGGSRTC